MMAFDLHRLRLLSELAERGTLMAVAQSLAYSPSAVSQQLSVLEREAGVPLLAKAGRGVRLTSAGQLLAHHARILLAAAEDAAADLASLSDDVRGTVRASGLQSVARRLLVPAAARVMTDHPQIRVEVSELELEEALPGLRLGSVDLVISDEYDGHPRPRPGGMRFTFLHAEPLKLVLPAAHPLAGAPGPVALADLRDEAWTASAVGTGHHAMIIGTCRSIGGYDPDLRHHSSDAEIQLELVRRVGAVALLPELTLPVRDDPELVIRDITETIRRRLVLVTRTGPTTPATTALLTAVNSEVQQLVRGGASPSV